MSLDAEQRIRSVDNFEVAGAFEIDPERDLHAFIVPGASHGANLTDSRALALEC